MITRLDDRKWWRCRWRAKNLRDFARRVANNHPLPWSRKAKPGALEEDPGRMQHSMNRGKLVLLCARSSVG